MNVGVRWRRTVVSRGGGRSGVMGVVRVVGGRRRVGGPGWIRSWVLRRRSEVRVVRWRDSSVRRPSRVRSLWEGVRELMLRLLTVVHV